MADAVGIIQSAVAAGTPRSASTSAAHAKAASSYAAATMVIPDGITTLSPLAPQYKTDPVAGLVTEFIDSNGNVVSQVPSTLALTYLRAGLTADGRKPEDVNASQSVFA